MFVLFWIYPAIFLILDAIGIQFFSIVNWTCGKVTIDLQFPHQSTPHRRDVLAEHSGAQEHLEVISSDIYPSETGDAYILCPQLRYLGRQSQQLQTQAYQ
jgi:hypothetical protein